MDRCSGIRMGGCFDRTLWAMRSSTRVLTAFEVWDSSIIVQERARSQSSRRLNAAVQAAGLNAYPLPVQDIAVLTEAT